MLAEQPRSCYVVGLDATHRVWPEAIDALERGAAAHRLAARTPRHPINRKRCLFARIGRGARSVAVFQSEESTSGGGR